MDGCGRAPPGAEAGLAWSRTGRSGPTCSPGRLEVEPISQALGLVPRACCAGSVAAFVPVPCARSGSHRLEPSPSGFAWLPKPWCPHRRGCLVCLSLFQNKGNLNGLGFVPFPPTSLLGACPPPL